MGQKHQVMVVDDDLAMCGFLRTFLGSRGYGAVTVTSGEEAVRRFHAERPAAVFLDVVMPGSMDGLAALAAFKKIDKDVPVIVISGQGRTNTVVQAMKLGANDFLCKPFEDAELEVLLSNALKQRQLSQEVSALREQLKEQSKYSMLFGHSERMAEVRDLIDRVSDTDVTVLIRGESGTGKELVARAVHERSLRKEKPFVKVNCAALPTELLESELFGFEKGAFTGAIQHKPGKFEFANYGTMFLDEIGEISYPLQAKLLQVLQDGEFSRLGGKNDVQVDVRIIAATNRDLEAAVADSQFREDLYFRLNVVTINLPPLRDRREEVPLLTDHFLKKYSVQYNKPMSSISPALQRQLMNYDWQRPAARESRQADDRARQRGADLQGAATAAAAAPVPLDPDLRAIARATAVVPGDAAGGRHRSRSGVAADHVGVSSGRGRGGRGRGRRGHGRRGRGGDGRGGVRRRRHDGELGQRLAQGHRPYRGARSRARADLPDADPHALESQGSRRNPRHQLQGAALQD
jgi:two-component system response regulator AtoC